LASFGGSREDLKAAVNRAPEIPTEEIESTISLGSSEDDMHVWAMRNLQKIDSDLTVTEHESPIPVGDIDILAEDSDGWVVVELKKGEAGDNAVGQIKGYMNDLKRETQEEARGILIAEDFSTRVKRAVADDNVDLYRLKLNPSLEAT
jgi:RecB family endonuclease NucS